ncbi:gamma-glutamylcyclotransferase [Microbacterium sp. zg.Y1090]|uniref:gamma-glutamylcyclotransferase n=1 Tax=Microbacterium TaxID=33882 RepID=UPI00214C824A|nr:MULTISPECIES: gamma-glutamylcyclotransferase [unclassified Microbacterium]MCR2812968.1 gamma-glutamylcyclotransferase [Microbacterium sp. zg.Y1084]MCR2817222.1 gamma-glutamylcyclotransferase [Microbacterium sp. zg.Y1090]MDL5486109.1 gamma-glutamylcyclotransferase [Microbacterium sp. zg-Y1211]WIM29287.1 gamma-glutamylcyclotransferase [Microbacterium sp. zg-Y1090]
MGDPGELLFSYGTLDVLDLQRDTFGRVLHGEPDMLPGYATEVAERLDPEIVERLGPIPQRLLRMTGDPRDKVTGQVLHLSDLELEAADELVSPLFHRLAVTLASGRLAWVYLAAQP